jgi:hypothetical protein
MTENPANPVGNPFCVLLANTGFNPALPVVFPTNFPVEFFYWIADADPATLPANVKVIRFAVEGSFANLPTTPVNGLQAAFMRIRMRITPPVPTASYTVTHPFGVKVFTPADIDPKKGFYNYTLDVPLLVPLDFVSLLNGPVGPFLKWDTGLPIVDATGNQYIGNPLIPHTVTGSPYAQNFVRIDGPNIGGPGINTVQTNNFLVAGKIAPVALPTPLVVNRATYSRTVGGQVDVFATSAATATVTVSGGPNMPAGPKALAGDGAGNFSAHVLVPNAAVLPPFVTLAASNPGNTATTIVSNITDVVTITSAIWKQVAKTITVSATSSDQAVPGPTLTAVGYGTLVNGTGTFPCLVPQFDAEVVSSAGGSAVALTTVANLTISGVVKTSAGINGKPVAGATVTLGGSAAAVTTTDALGKYSFVDLVNGAYTVTPSLTGFTFAPASLAVTLAGASAVNQNFVMGGFSVSGAVKTKAGVAMPGVTITMSGSATGSVLTGVNGGYTFKGLPSGSVVTITPSQAGITFIPVSKAVTVNGANVAAVNFRGP